MSFTIEVEETNRSCPTGEIVGKRNLTDGKIPVLACEGGCIHGEIVRLAANLVSQRGTVRPWLSRRSANCTAIWHIPVD